MFDYINNFKIIFLLALSEKASQITYKGLHYQEVCNQSDLQYFLASEPLPDADGPSIVITLIFSLIFMPIEFIISFESRKGGFNIFTIFYS